MKISSCALYIYISVCVCARISFWLISFYFWFVLIFLFSRVYYGFTPLWHQMSRHYTSRQLIILYSNMKLLKTPNSLATPQYPWCNFLKLRLPRMAMSIWLTRAPTMQHETWGESSWNLGAWIRMPLCWFISQWWTNLVFGSLIFPTIKLFWCFVVETKFDFWPWNLIDFYDVHQHFPCIAFELL